MSSGRVVTVLSNRAVGGLAVRNRVSHYAVPGSRLGRGEGGRAVRCGAVRFGLVKVKVRGQLLRAGFVAARRVIRDAMPRVVRLVRRAALRARDVGADYSGEGCFFNSGLKVLTTGTPDNHRHTYMTVLTSLTELCP